MSENSLKPGGSRSIARRDLDWSRNTGDSGGAVLATVKPCEANRAAEANDAALLAVLKKRFENSDRIRRGVCLLNAAQYDQAEAAFREAIDHGSTDESLPAYLAACLMGEKKPEAASEQFSRAAPDDRPLPGRTGPPAAETIRRALALEAAGKPEPAIQALRDGIRLDPESAELHFQLGTLLVSREHYEEAELRFTQALNIESEHIEALVSLALCCAVRGAVGEAYSLLQRAQRRRPYDARIGLLLVQAAKAVQQQGLSARARAVMPDLERPTDHRGIEELARIIESDPDFVDAFLAIPAREVETSVFVVLLKTLEKALERRPEQAELHYHCGRVLERLDRSQEAIDRNERAVEIDPLFTRALIELGKLYHKTDRRADATTRLEQAVAAGADYADVYYLLGNLYRDQGYVGRAREAYARALLLNDTYEPAARALEALPS